MGNLVMISKTLSPENQLKIRCPIFNAETRIAGCFMLRDLVWRGEGPEQRQGCQCAMRAGKCPIPVILTRMVRTGEDPLHSAEPKVGRIDDDILDKIAPVLVPETQMRRFSLSPQEEKAIAQANEDARSGKRAIKKYERRPERVIEELPARASAPKPKEAPPTTDATVAAATSGDMSAAINAAAGE